MAKREFELYESLSSEQRIYISDFEIISAIRNYPWETAINPINSNRTEERLFDVIHAVLNKDEENTNVSYIADKIVEAWADDLVSLETLEKSSKYAILDCARGVGNFSDLERDNLEEDIEKQLKGLNEILDYSSYQKIINTALESTSNGNWCIDLVNEYGLNKSEIKVFQEFLSKDERVSDIEWSNGNTEVDIIFYLKYCPNAEEDEYDESKYTEIDAKNPLLKGWKWGYFNDGSGLLISPSGKEYFIFDWSTKEYKTYKDSPWDLHHDDITGKSDFKSFEKYAEDYAVENLLKLEDSIENKNGEDECL